MTNIEVRGVEELVLKFFRTKFCDSFFSNIRFCAFLVAVNFGWFEKKFLVQR